VNLDALVTQGQLPWSPNSDASDLDVWYEYESPRVGTFTVRGATILFSAVDGVEGRLSVWAYTCLAAGEARDLETKTFASLSGLRQFVQKIFDGRQLVLALADDLVITSWTAPEDQGGLYEVATAFLEQVLAQSRGRLNADTTFRAKLAEVDVATHELV
jgi:hypothetical protein